MPKIKLCKDCKYFDKQPEFAYCLVPQEIITHDLVYGSVIHKELRDCYRERNGVAAPSTDRCGSQGIYWKEKPI